MPTSTSTVYAARWPVPELVERSAGTQTIRCRIYRAGSQVVPTSGTVTVSRPAGTELVSASAVTVASDGTASYAVPDTSGEQLSDGWRFVWALLLPDGETHTFAVDGALVRARLHPVISEVDLYRRLPYLDPDGRAPVASRGDYSAQLEEAWHQISNWLIERGNRPWLVLSPSALRQPHLELTAALVLEELAGRGDAAKWEMAQTHRLAYRDALAGVTLRYDYDRDGVIDDPDARRGAGAGGVLWTCGRGWERA